MQLPKLTIPDVIDRFRVYHEADPTWGLLHIVLDDSNVSNNGVRFCVEDALERGDAEGHALALLLLQLSVTQRRKLRTL
jgi:hypothetical protein